MAAEPLGLVPNAGRSNPGRDRWKPFRARIALCGKTTDSQSAID